MANRGSLLGVLLMRQMKKAEFCSDAWVANSDAIVRDLVAEFGSQIGSERRITVKTFHNPPPHLRQDGQDFVRWSFEIGDGTGRASRDDLPHALIRRSAD